jgi:hypothetical protein
MSDNLWAVDMEHGLLPSSKFGLSCADVRARWAGAGGRGRLQSCPQIRNILGCPMPDYFGDCQNFCPKNSDCPWFVFFPQAAYPHPLLFSSLSLCFFTPSNWGESFQNSNYPVSLVNLSQFTKPWGCEVADLGRWVNQHPGWYHGKTTKFI